MNILSDKVQRSYDGSENPSKSGPLLHDLSSYRDVPLSLHCIALQAASLKIPKFLKHIKFVFSSGMLHLQLPLLEILFLKFKG